MCLCVSVRTLPLPTAGRVRYPGAQAPPARSRDRFLRQRFGRLGESRFLRFRFARFRFINTIDVERLVYIFYRIVCDAIALLPLSLACRLGSAVGWLAYWVAAPYRRLAFRNLSLAFEGEKTPAELRRLTRRHFARLGANVLGAVKVAAMPEKEVLKRVTIEGLEHFLAAQALGKGIVAIASHLGNWELLAVIAPQIFVGKVGTVYMRLGNRFVDADVRRMRSRLGTLTFERKEGFQGASACLRGNGAVAVLIDQHAGDAGIWCPFFGRLASTSPLAATLALRTGAALMPITAFTGPKPGTWRFVIGEAVTVATRDPRVLTAELNLVLEKLIRSAPEDWFWVHNRWKTPCPNFLLADYKRGVAYPEGFAQERLKPFRIVLRSGNWLGDAVMSVPAVRAIKEGRPDARVTVLTRAKLADFWKRVAEVDEVLSIEPDDSVFGVVRKLRDRFDVAVVFPNSIRTALEPWLAGVPRRVGYPAHWRRWFLNQIMPPLKPQQLCRPARHQVHHYLDLAATLGANVGAEKELFAQRSGPRPGGRVRLGLCPGAEYGPAKRWPADRFAEVARRVADRLDCEWVLFGVASDAPAGAEIEKGLAGKCVNLIGKTTLAELMDRLAECRLLLTNDTGTMHLAAFLGVPVVAIFGSTEPRLTGPLGGGHVVLRHQVECSPCFERECPLDFRCMNAVTVEETTDAVVRLFSASPNAGP